MLCCTMGFLMSSGVPGRLGLRCLARFLRSEVPVVGNGGQQECRGGHANGAHEGVDGAIEWQHDAQEPKDQRCTAQAQWIEDRVRVGSLTRNNYILHSSAMPRSQRTMACSQCQSVSHMVTYFNRVYSTSPCDRDRGASLNVSL